MAKILIVEDDLAIAELLRQHFVKDGHQTVVAEDGLAGTLAAAREKPDMVVLDFNMPAANGVKLLERLRGSTFTASTPVLFVTASPIVQLMAQVPDDARVRFIHKPVDFPLLSKITRELLGGHITPSTIIDGPLELD